MNEFDVEPEWDKRKGPKPAPEEPVAEEHEVVDVSEEKELPALMKASDLLPPEEPLPFEDGETPPDPGFLITRNAYGPGAHSVKFSNGTPVGVWASESGLDGAGVRAELTRLGLDEDLIDFFARNRDAGIQATDLIMADPGLQAFAAEEERTKQSKEAMSKAFIEAYKKKQKEKT